jgi:hypothetical protein
MDNDLPEIQERKILVDVEWDGNLLHHSYIPECYIPKQSE